MDFVFNLPIGAADVVTNARIGYFKSVVVAVLKTFKIKFWRKFYYALRLCSILYIQTIYSASNVEDIVKDSMQSFVLP